MGPHCRTTKFGCFFFLIYSTIFVNFISFHFIHTAPGNDCAARQRCCSHPAPAPPCKRWDGEVVQCPKKEDEVVPEAKTLFFWQYQILNTIEKAKSDGRGLDNTLANQHFLGVHPPGITPGNKEHKSSARFHSRTFFAVVVVVDMPLRNYLLGAKYPGNHSKYNPQSFMIQLSRFQ